MKDKVMDALQRFSKAMFIPVLILPIAGILIAVGNLFTNVRLQAVLPFLNNPVTIGFGTLLSGSLNAILGNLGVIFCVGLSVGLANKKKSEAGFISLLAFLVFLNAMNKFMNMRGMLVEGSLSGTGQAMVLGVQVLDPWACSSACCWASWWLTSTTASARLSSTTPSRSTAAPVLCSSC